MKQYVLKKYKDFDPKAKQYQYAAIFNIKKQELSLLVLFESNLFEKRNYHIMSGSAKQKGTNHHFCLVTMDEVYLDFFTRMPEIIGPVLMHELGHFLNGDWDPTKREKSSQQIYQERIMLNMLGKVPKEELNADCFAAKEVGVDKVIKALRLLKKEREKGAEQGSELAIKEFENRIKALEEMQKDNLAIFYRQ